MHGFWGNDHVGMAVEGILAKQKSGFTIGIFLFKPFPNRPGLHQCPVLVPEADLEPVPVIKPVSNDTVLSGPGAGEKRGLSRERQTGKYRLHIRGPALRRKPGNMFHFL